MSDFNEKETGMTSERFKLMEVHNNGSVDVNMPIGSGVEIEFAVEPDGRKVTFWGFNVEGEANRVLTGPEREFPDCELVEDVRAFAASKSKVIWERAAS